MQTVQKQNQLSEIDNQCMIRNIRETLEIFRMFQEQKQDCNFKKSRNYFLF